METMEKERVVTELATKSANGTFESIVYAGEHTMNKGGRSGANTLYGRVTKIVSVTNLQFGVNYENKVNNERERNGEERNFKSGEMKGVYWVLFPCLVRAYKSGKLQLRCTLTSATKFTTDYFVDGRPATADEVDMIKFYTPQRSDDLVVFNITAEKILSWNICGERFYDADLAAQFAQYRQVV